MNGRPLHCGATSHRDTEKENKIEASRFTEKPTMGFCCGKAGGGRNQITTGIPKFSKSQIEEVERFGW